MWLYVNEQLVNLDYATWITKGSLTSISTKGKVYPLFISITGDERPIELTFKTEAERNECFERLAIGLMDNEEPEEPIEEVDEEGQEIIQ